MSSSENQFSSPPGYDVDEATPESHPPAISSATNLPASDHTAVTPPAQAASPLPHATSEPARPVEQDPAAPALPERPAEEEFPDPQIASLHAIFPDFDASLLQTVLESVGGDQDRAVDTLLGMSDPDHVPTAAPTQPVVVRSSA
ncbi:hypothetical protein BV25DRAFT_1820881 [Artomyces pyxidatus]|uniref:Uncharacterized protein n=1 Tax=Artomyces pyxidatus TaxID=48021 RepID=A0ACB8TB49_9AGAM|nr:hypothetical protein BV25DRAFT_1820881 [Artomyces pyxidatus]